MYKFNIIQKFTILYSIACISFMKKINAKICYSYHWARFSFWFSWEVLVFVRYNIKDYHFFTFSRRFSNNRYLLHISDLIKAWFPFSLCRISFSFTFSCMESLIIKICDTTLIQISRDKINEYKKNKMIPDKALDRKISIIIAMRISI